VFHEVENKRENYSQFWKCQKNRKRWAGSPAEGSETATTLSEPTTRYYSSEPQQLTQLLQQPLLPDSWYKTRVEIIRKMYPELSRHKKTKTKSWKEVYNEYLAK
jgi:hypothetical protein